MRCLKAMFSWIARRLESVEEKHLRKLVVAGIAISLLSLILDIGGDICRMRAASRRCEADAPPACRSEAEALAITANHLVVCSCPNQSVDPWVLYPER